MVNFNLKDLNMEAIAKASKLNQLETRNEYRIYGLAQDGNHPVLFSGQESVVNAEQEKTLANFLKTNGIDSAMEDCDTKDRKVYIGLRFDVRQDAELAANLVQTFVYYLEGRLKLPADFKVGSIPTFKV
jgi:hypothetical protein